MLCFLVYMCFVVLEKVFDWLTRSLVWVTLGWSLYESG